MVEDFNLTWDFNDKVALDRLSSWIPQLIPFQMESRV